MTELLDEPGVYLCENPFAARRYFLAVVPDAPQGSWSSRLEVQDTRTGERRPLAEIPAFEMVNIIEDLACGLARHILDMPEPPQ